MPVFSSSDRASGRRNDDPLLRFASPAATTLDELLALRAAAQSLQRRVQKKSAAPSSGGAMTRRLGRGLDFAEVREYQPGDDVRMIDWKVTARSGRAHTKLFVEERERPVLLLVDQRSAMRFGTKGLFKSAMASRLAALLGWCAVQSHDRVGGFIFGDHQHSEIRPQSGRRGLMALFQAMQGFHSDAPLSGPEPRASSPLISTLQRLRHGVHAGSTVIVFSDFDGFDEAAQRALGRSINTLDMIAVHITDALDQSLPPPGHYPLVSQSGGGGAIRWLLSVGGHAERQPYRQAFLHEQQRLHSYFTRHRHAFISVSGHDDLLDAAARILRRQSDNLFDNTAMEARHE